MRAFRRIAVVNRGEAAMRLLHAVRELNQQHRADFRTIALYTDPDRASLFVREADESICLGAATFVDPKDGQTKSSYLDYGGLQHALRAARAEAAWVGWGFVAEHAEFAELCTKLGIAFIGPSAESMRRVGDKIASKRLAESASVPVSPWSGGPLATLQDARQAASRLGLPLMLKASAGGGGRGVRRIDRMEQLDTAFESARAEALKFFGSDAIFLEKAIDGARHVEVQVLADDRGTTWAVGVRDCSMQRRNQKVLEEAPGPGIDARLELQLRDAAVRIAKAAGYCNAGTVEFLLCPETSALYFMEMNTRLQVEHPVTEATTGLDLVKLQLRLAAGGLLHGDPPACFGHAIEVRLNAEDPDQNFSPSPGLIERLQLPTGPGLRVDTGVREGDLIAPEFDSMIAKIIAWGCDRSEALARLQRALVESVVVIRGGTCNKAFLLELLSQPDVARGGNDIRWMDRFCATRQRTVARHGSVALIQAALDVHDSELAIEKTHFFSSAARGRSTVRAELGHAVELRYFGQTYKLDVRRIGPNQFRVGVEGRRIDVTAERQGPHERWLTCSGCRHRVMSVVHGVEHRVEVDGIPHRISRDDAGAVRASAPAVVLAIHVKPGDKVEAGDRLLALEAMKMEMAVTAPCAGRVQQVLAHPNLQVHAGSVLVILEPCGDRAQVQASERVDFEQDGRELPLPSWSAALEELKRLVLGYDIDAQEAKAMSDRWTSSYADGARDDGGTRGAEDEVLGIFADILTLFRQDPPRAFEQPISAEDRMLAYLRSVHLAGKGLSESLVDKLKKALRHYGVRSLEPTTELHEALLFIHKAHRRMD
jgi:acetyl/propionyl-CoA carboxylase alpha subunit